ncbi:C-terminal helicase domain-containing protein [Streptomyces sp. NPDC056230]|uniref:C-terminal helicase domain-containing protein n=1 Tax=unclassified Streptomyces TaxID=2593676 RepID=UPI0035D6E12F
MSAWLTPDQVASGALSLGYAMTIAASQGMTCDTSLLYGHGANAFATYPGLTRGKKANHLWLPLQVVENETTQARLGTARSEKERLERAVDAFAKFLGQSRPDAMVSDLLHEPPAPTAVPSPARTRTVDRQAAVARSVSTTIHGQRQRAARPQKDEYRLTDEQKRQLAAMKEERELARVGPWNRRPYGDRTDQELTRLIAVSPIDARREDRAAAAAEETERALLEQLASDKARGETRGRREVAPIYPLLDLADKQLLTARAERVRETVAAAHAAKADEHLRQLAAADGKGRIALRLAGTSRKEHRQLTQQATEQRAAGWREAADARVAAARAAETAWKMLRTSPHAAVLGATEDRTPDVDTLAARLTEMREAWLPARIQQIDTSDEKKVSRAHGQATRARETAAMYRAVAADARTEKALRARIAEHHPSLHRSETRARAELQQTQEVRSSRAAVQSSLSYQPPTRSRSGPRQGRR